MSEENVSKQVLDKVLVNVAVELGATVMTYGEVSELGVGSIIQLDKEVGDLFDIEIGGMVVAQGEIVTMGDHFGVKVVEVYQ